MSIRNDNPKNDLKAIITLTTIAQEWVESGHPELSIDTMIRVKGFVTQFIETPRCDCGEYLIDGQCQYTPTKND